MAELCAALALSVTCGWSQGTFVNGNFESGDFSGWTRAGGYWGGEWPIDASTYLPGGPNFDREYSVTQVVGPGPLPDPRTDGRLDAVYSGSKTAKINDEYSNNSISVISQTVPNYTAAHIYFAWAAVLQASHGPTDSDNFVLQLTDVTTNEVLYSVAYNSALAATAPLFTQSSEGWYFTSWQVQDLDVSTRTGHTFTLTLLASDCPYGGHAGYVYLDGFGAVTPPSGPAGGEDNGPRPLSVVPETDLGTFRVGDTIRSSVLASGGSGVYKYSWVGSAPEGFTLEGANVTGTAKVAGTFGFSIVAEDSKGATAVTRFRYTVFGFAFSALPPGIQLSPYLFSLALAGATQPASFEVSGLPPGLSATSSGTIQGVVRAPGSWPVTITAKDATGASVSGTFALAVTIPSLLSVVSGSLPGGTVNNVYSQDLAAQGGAPPYSWSLVAGPPPDGISVRTSGTISGIPTRPGSYTFSVRATDVTGGSATGEVTLTVAPQALTIRTPSPMATGMEGVEYPEEQLSAAGGTPPYRFSVTASGLPRGLSLSPAGLISGTPSPGTATDYFVPLTVTDSAGATGTATPRLTIRPFSTDILLSAGSLLFELPAGTTVLPPAQAVGAQITKPGTALPYSATVLPAGTTWLKVSPTEIAPGRLTVSLTEDALKLPSAGTTYSATVRVICTDLKLCAGDAQELLVALRVTNVPPQLSYGPDLLSLSRVAGAQGGTSGVLELQNTGGGAVGIASATCAASWCTVAGTPGFLPSGQPVGLAVSVDPTGLSRGYYRTTLNIHSSSGNSAIPVTMFVSDSDSIGLLPLGAQFESQAGGVPDTDIQTFQVTAAGNGGVNWSAEVVPGANWLVATTPSGNASESQPGTVKYRIEPGVAAGLGAGAHYGQIRVNAAGVTNSPLDFLVVLNIAPAGAVQRPSPTPAGLLFIAPGTGPTPAQSVTIVTRSAQPVVYTAGVQTDSPWLSVSPETGIATPGNPAISRISVNTSKLTPGIYYGGVTYEFAGPVRTVNVVLIVPRSGQASTTLLQNRAEGCAAKQLAIAPSTLPGNFAAPAVWPTPVILRLLNDCGDPVTNGQMVTTFSNGDPPLALTLADPKTGTYAATWTPRRTGSQVTVTARGTAPGLAAATLQIPGAVTPNEAPQLDEHGALHLFNPLVGGAVAPGTLLTVNGTALAGTTARAPAGTLPTKLLGTQVIVGGVPAPIASVSPTKLQVQLPTELGEGKSYQVVVNANGALTTPQPLQVTAVAPGVQASAGGYVAALHADGSAVSKAAPAQPGEKISLVLAGLGATDPPVASGAVTQADPPVTLVNPVTITVDGTAAAVSFAGLKAGSTGIYQIDFTVPANAKDGDLAVEITQGDQPANSTIMPVRKKP